MDKERAKEEFGRLLDTIELLREKCPWDRKQTKESLRKLTIEETYELADAIIDDDMVEIKKELGDLLLHIVFYAKIGDEGGHFDMSDIIESLIDKLVYRHPHIYRDTDVQNSEDVLKNWESLKLKEKGREGKGVLDGVPRSLPALTKATRIQEKARGAGFDWEYKEQVWDKVREELEEVEAEIKSGTVSDLEGEIGDFMFSIINAARLYDIDPDIALERTNKKFIYRFKFIETEAKKMGRSLKDLTLAEMDIIWNEAKKSEKL